MPTYHNAGAGYPNVSAPARQSKVDGNQNHHTIPSNITAHSLLQNALQSMQSIQSIHSIPSLPSNLTGTNMLPHPVSPIMTTHSSVTSQNIPTHMSPMPSPVILTPSVVTNPNNTTALSANMRHEVKLNAMP